MLFQTDDQLRNRAGLQPAPGSVCMVDLCRVMPAGVKVRVGGVALVPRWTNSPGEVWILNDNYEPCALKNLRYAATTMHRYRCHKIAHAGWELPHSYAKLSCRSMRTHMQRLLPNRHVECVAKSTVLLHRGLTFCCDRKT